MSVVHDAVAVEDHPAAVVAGEFTDPPQRALHPLIDLLRLEADELCRERRDQVLEGDAILEFGIGCPLISELSFQPLLGVVQLGLRGFGAQRDAIHRIKQHLPLCLLIRYVDTDKDGPASSTRHHRDTQA